MFPKLGGVLIANEAGASFVRGQKRPSGVEDSIVMVDHLSAMQMTRGCAGTLIDLAGTVEIRPDQVVVVPVLLVGVRPTKLPEESPEKTIFHQIELVPGRVPAPAH